MVGYCFPWKKTLLVVNLNAWWEQLVAQNLSPWVTLAGLDWYGHWSHCAAACQLPALALLEVQLLNS